MYKNGELIIYGGTGVCRVEGTETRPDKGGAREYYILKPICQSGTIYIPVDTQVYMRPVISREEAERLIDAIPGVKAEEIHERSFTQLAAHYEQLIARHDCDSLLQLLVSIRAKKRYAESCGRKFGQIDTRYLKRAETLFFGELSAALDMDSDSVERYIAERGADKQ